MSKSKDFIDWLCTWVDKDNKWRVYHFINVSAFEQYINVHYKRSIRDAINTRIGKKRKDRGNMVKYYVHPKVLDPVIDDLDFILSKFGFPGSEEPKDKLRRLKLLAKDCVNSLNIQEKEDYLNKKEETIRFILRKLIRTI